jgi:hypothetical protein
VQGPAVRNAAALGRGDPVCQPLAKCEFIRENAIDVSTDQLSLGGALKDLALDIAYFIEAPCEQLTCRVLARSWVMFHGSTPW